MGVLIFILILSFLVIIHELGHFFAARWAGMKVDEFGLGYPPRVKRLFSWKGTQFTLNWVPFGGFVHIQGEDGYLQKKAPKKGSFMSVSTPKQMVVIMAGVIVNFLFGAIVFAALFSYLGIPKQSDGVLIVDVAPGSPAEQIGLLGGEHLVGFTGPAGRSAIRFGSDVFAFVGVHQGTEITIHTNENPCNFDEQACRESAQSRQVYLRLPEEIPAGQGSLGITFESTVEYQRYPWYQMPFRGIAYGFVEAIKLGIEIVKTLSIALTQLVTLGRSSMEISGPVGIAHEVQKQDLFATGLISILSFSAMISINLAVMNLLPIPALDGGRAVFIMLRSLMDSRALRLVEYYSNYGGYALLLSLIVLITLKDIWAIIIGG